MSPLIGEMSLKAAERLKDKEFICIKAVNLRILYVGGLI